MVADVSASNTKVVNVDLGVEIMGGFLKGMGVNSISLKEQFKGVTKVSFAFRNVNRIWVDIGELGQQLIGKTFDKSNPANNDFLYEELECLLIDSIITSNNFTINIEQSTKNDFSLNIPKLEQILELKNKVEVDQLSKKSISFSNKKSLAFAFSCVQLKLNQKGQIIFNTQVDQFYLNERKEQNNESEMPKPFPLFQEDLLSEIN